MGSVMLNKYLLDGVAGKAAGEGGVSHTSPGSFEMVFPTSGPHTLSLATYKAPPPLLKC